MSGFVYYLTGSWIFLATLIVGSHVVSAPSRRQERFSLRLVVGIAAQLALSVPIMLAYYAVSSADGISALVGNIAAVAAYAVMFALSVIALRFCYDMPLRECLLSGLAGYATQHICYNIYSLINTGNAFIGVCYMLGEVPGYLINTLAQLAVAAVVLFIVRLVFAHGRENARGVAGTSVILLAAGTLFIVLIANAVVNIYRGESAVLSALSGVLLICCCIFILFLRSDMLERRRLSVELGAIDRLRAKELKHYEQLKSNMDLVNIKCHDIKHYIDSAGSGMDIAELKKLTDIYDSELKTGNETLDITLSEYSIYCSSHDIIFTAFADGSALGFMTVSDICSLFGNILENAVEAAEKVKDKEKRVVSINVRNVAGQISVCAENYFDGDLDLRGGMPVSTKGDPDRHGFGVRSIKMIAEKYGGSLECRAEGGLFTLGCMIPIKESDGIK